MGRKGLRRSNIMRKIESMEARKKYTRRLESSRPLRRQLEVELDLESNGT